jgi:hypothetical protein
MILMSEKRKIAEGHRSEASAWNAAWEDAMHDLLTEKETNK